MKIIHLILGKANPERMNGVNRVVHEMATVQKNSGYNVEVWGITANPQHDYPKRKFTTRLFAASKNPFRLNADLKNAFVQMKGEMVVHIHGAFIPRFYSAAQFFKQHQIPFIITPHSSYNEEIMKKNPFIKKIYFNLFEKKLLNNAFKVHLLGKTEWAGLNKIYHNKKSMMMPYGFSRTAFNENAIEKNNTFTIAYCGRISIYSKGLDTMLQGFSLFHQQHPQSQLMIIGDGAEKQSLQEMAKQLHIEDAVVFTGPVFGEEKIRLLQQAHVFAHPSRTDGIPATIVEAASLGLPCVVSEATNTGDYIHDYKAGYTMKEYDAQNFNYGLKDVYEEIKNINGIKQYRQNAFKMIDEVFNWETILKKFNQTYSQAALSYSNN